jgi:hypothetical protein
MSGTPAGRRRREQASSHERDIDHMRGGRERASRSVDRDGAGRHEAEVIGERRRQRRLAGARVDVRILAPTRAAAFFPAAPSARVSRCRAQSSARARPASDAKKSAIRSLISSAPSAAGSPVVAISRAAASATIHSITERWTNENRPSASRTRSDPEPTICSTTPGSSPSTTSTPCSSPSASVLTFRVQSSPASRVLVGEEVLRPAGDDHLRVALRRGRSSPPIAGVRSSGGSVRRVRGGPWAPGRPTSGARGSRGGATFAACPEEAGAPLRAQ